METVPPLFSTVEDRAVQPVISIMDAWLKVGNALGISRSQARKVYRDDLPRRQDMRGRKYCFVSEVDAMIRSIKASAQLV